MRLHFLIVLLAASGCTAQLKEEKNTLEDQVAALHQELGRLQADNDLLTVELEDLRRDLTNLQTAEASGLDPNQELWAKLKTSRGTILCRLEPAKAPGLVSNFVALAEGTKEWTDPTTQKTRTDPLYDGTSFHRVVPGFAIQGGDPSGTGHGGPGFRLPDEFHPDLKHHAGTLSLANRGPNTNGSQFFITEASTPHLDGKHSVLGYCEPLSLIKDIGSVPIQTVEGADESTRPVDPVLIEHLTIHRNQKPR